MCQVTQVEGLEQQQSALQQQQQHVDALDEQAAEAHAAKYTAEKRAADVESKSAILRDRLNSGRGNPRASCEDRGELLFGRWNSRIKLFTRFTRKGTSPIGSRAKEAGLDGVDNKPY